jgi:hypothetical protein
MELKSVLAERKYQHQNDQNLCFNMFPPSCHEQIGAVFDHSYCERKPLLNITDHHLECLE